MALDPVALGLPHREPFIFIDAVDEFTPGERAVARKTFAESEPFFRGHFPGEPIVPGVILAEALAQTAGLAAGQEGRALRLAAIRMMKFPAAVRPNEQIQLTATKSGATGGLWQFEVIAAVGDRIVAQGAVVLAES